MVYLGLIMGPPIPRGPFNPPIFPMFLRSYCGPGRRVECRRSWEVMVIPWVFLRKSSCYHWYHTWMETPGTPVGTIQKKNIIQTFYYMYECAGLVTSKCLVWWWFSRLLRDFCIKPRFSEARGYHFLWGNRALVSEELCLINPPEDSSDLPKSTYFLEEDWTTLFWNSRFFLKVNLCFCCSSDARKWWRIVKVLGKKQCEFNARPNK